MNLIDEVMAMHIHDNRGQLTSAVDSNTVLPDEDYDYDDNGNRELVDNVFGADQDFEIDRNNRLAFDGTHTYLHDDEGNRTAKFIDTNVDGDWDTNEEGIAYTWDHRNRLVNVTFVNTSNVVTESIDYGYDGFNQLIHREVDPDGALGSDDVLQTIFVYDDGQVVLQFDKTGSGSVADTDLSHRYLWGPGIDELLADERVHLGGSNPDTTTYWALTDHLGTARDWVDAGGEVVDHAIFDSYGNRTNADTFGSAFQWTGRWRDPITGLQWNRARWYNPEIQRWMSEDFVWDGYNKGVYAGNAPTMFVDPFGLETGNPNDPIFDIVTIWEPGVGWVSYRPHHPGDMWMGNNIGWVPAPPSRESSFNLNLKFRGTWTVEQKLRIRDSMRRVLTRVRELEKEINAELSKLEPCVRDRLRFEMKFLVENISRLRELLEGNSRISVSQAGTNPDVDAQYYTMWDILQLNENWDDFHDRQLDELLFHELSHNKKVGTTDDSSRSIFDNAHILQIMYRGGLANLPAYQILVRQTRQVCNGETLEGIVIYRERPDTGDWIDFHIWLWEILP